MDTKALVDHVFSKTRLRIDEHDPIFALVALNEAILADLLAQQKASSGQFLTELDQRTAALSGAVDASRRAIAEYVTAAKQDIERTGKGVAESVREGAKQAGIDGALSGYAQVERKAISQITEATTNLNDALKKVQHASEALAAAAKSTERQTSGVSLGALLASLAAFAVVVLGGFWLMEPSLSKPSVAFYRSLTPEQQTQVWHALPRDVQLTISQSYQQPK
ncbi:hypothetical protein [Burkholderia ubonensis]|uniref:hypothetical protein n=1 Tax=Burkholderia ubonensis TaxID=101571 RepID=UPI000751F391|nr:hypothetical protein [Burkholderia ubonensis]KVR13148.1 hypothetical protein WK12_11800 [Burkholderia ubonensis]